MKRITLMLAALLLVGLCGCSRAEMVWETVDDELPAEPVSYLDEAYSMNYDVPQDAAAQTFAPETGKTVWEQTEGDYEIVSEVFLTSGVDSAIRRISGFEPEQLRILMTSRYGMPEYQFAWYSAGDEGGRLYRADLLMDDLYCYALTFSVREGLGSVYDTTTEQVFSSFSLFYDEGV